MARYVGADWGSNGWVCAEREDGDWEATVLPSFLDVWDEYREADQILVDIPIGLPENGRRECDAAAKEFLGSAPQRVFWTPPREALTARSYEAAKEIVERETEGSMTTQSWSLLPRIREVDTFFGEFPDTHGQIRESHPEVCFAALAERTAVGRSKQTVDGMDDRLEILGEYDEGVADAHERIVTERIENLSAHGRRFSASNDDDIVDAMALAVTAARADGEIDRLPSGGDIPTDKRDLPMEIVYHAPEE